jgi:hypothetical protein
MDKLGEGVRTSDPRSAHQCRLMDVAERYYQQGRRHGISEGDGAWHSAQRTVQTQLTAESQAVSAPWVELVAGNKQSDCDGEIQPSTHFSHPGGRQIHGHPVHGPLQTAREDRRANPVTRLSYGCIGQPNDREAGKATRDVDFD